MKPSNQAAYDDVFFALCFIFAGGMLVSKGDKSGFFLGGFGALWLGVRIYHIKNDKGDA